MLINYNLYKYILYINLKDPVSRAVSNTFKNNLGGKIHYCRIIVLENYYKIRKMIITILLFRGSNLLINILFS